MSGQNSENPASDKMAGSYVLALKHNNNTNKDNAEPDGEIFNVKPVFILESDIFEVSSEESDETSEDESEKGEEIVLSQSTEHLLDTPHTEETSKKAELPKDTNNIHVQEQNSSELNSGIMQPANLIWNGHGAVWLNDVNCSGSENKLLDCNFNNVTIQCVHHDDVGIHCFLNCSTEDEGMKVKTNV
ncbi:unnamed protein product [Mytilus coruscus]|uniref:SRCR domain-containing protein n=1 Tax=Mytilus coruscus TaxID=42192 RepID=A0A6J8ACP6_MYTCO|nr:unnamed protein product [Mytilus coruscus]